MKKKQPVKGIINQSSMLYDPAYYRLRAEILALKAMVETAWIHSAGVELESKEYGRMRKEFKKMFSKLCAFHHGRLLTQVENVDPELAAELDNRGPEEVDSH